MLDKTAFIGLSRIAPGVSASKMINSLRRVHQPRGYREYLRKVMNFTTRPSVLPKAAPIAGVRRTGQQSLNRARHMYKVPGGGGVSVPGSQLPNGISFAA
jgi:hypothetical protein